MEPRPYSDGFARKGGPRRGAAPLQRQICEICPSGDDHAPTTLDIELKSHTTLAAIFKSVNL